jgi:hypothetical protein
MDLSQLKLSKQEWGTIEIPVSMDEKQILNMIVDGFSNVNIKSNQHHSLFTFTKIDVTPEIEYFLFKKYFEDTIQEMLSKYAKTTLLKYNVSYSGGQLKSIKSADSIRIQNLENNIKINRSFIFEYLLLDLGKDLLKHIYKKKQKYAFYLYTLIQIKKSSIHKINKYVVEFIDKIIEFANSFTKTSSIITNAYEFIEKNVHLLKYEDKTLFPHQKELFTICKKTDNFRPKLVLYTAPTGTGKTLSPIGLSTEYRIIFVCVARHIGLALAKSAISVEKKVAFAFGCETASDIRLHYFSALNYSINKKTGGIGKVDNSVGDNVEIMICDVKSYITAMHYMLAFNDASNIIVYWDEPTITMDYETHELHETIKMNWANNIIPTMILSCATLPHIDEIQSIFDDFGNKFDFAELHTITSFDCKKSIPILNKDSFCVLPHYMYENYNDLLECTKFCEKNKTMLRYFDLREIIKFIEYVNDGKFMDDIYSIDNYFSSNISEISMNRLKEYYLTLLSHLNPDKWPNIYKYLISNRKRKYETSKYLSFFKTSSFENTKLNGSKLERTSSMALPPTSPVSPTPNLSGILLTTADAYTLTDGPTIFLTDNVNKIGQFYIKQSNINETAFQSILQKITKNSEITNKIASLESIIFQKESKTNMDTGKVVSSRESGRLCNESQNVMDEINKLRKEIRSVSLDPMYVPNTKPHQELWVSSGEIHENAYVCNIDENTTKKIMAMNVDNNLKILLLLGIGTFAENLVNEYTELMKNLADEQKLFIIIASTDYIYGTNYQFCHGVIGKDLENMTQQKTLQALGRIGRNNIQQDYTVRFRDDNMIMNLFKKQEYNLEAINMCKLFTS